jgi:hypothetical protein
MKRTLAVAAVVALILSGCGRHPLRQAGGVGSGGTGGGAVVAVTPAAPPPTTRPAAPAGIDTDLSTLDQELSTVDSELAQAAQAADSDTVATSLPPATTVLTAAVTVPAASPAPGTLAGEKAVALARIDGRLHTLAALKTAIGAATHLTGGHRGTLAGLVSADISGLTALRAKVGGEQTVAAVRTDERGMVVDYRIYLLVVPKVRLTIASDVETAAVATLGGVHDTLAAAIAKAKAQGKDVSAEQAELTDLASQAAAAGSAVAGRADALLAVAPSADPSAMSAAVSPVRAAVRGARQDLRKAVADARQIRKQLG